MSEAIKIENVKKSFNDKWVLKNIHMSVMQGEKMMLLGKSGSGKTTLLKLLNALQQPTDGAISVKGEDISKLSPIELRRSMGYVIQRIGLLPHLTIRENLTLPKQIIGAKASEHRLEELLRMVKMETSVLNRFPHELSGGQQQRVGLARALMNDPDIILMDEPFSALDPITRKQLRSDIKNLEQLKHKTIVMVTHDIEEALEIGDRIAMLDDGALQQIGNPQEILFEPANDFVKDFVGQDSFRLKLRTVSPKDLDLPIAHEHPDLLSFLADERIETSLKTDMLTKFFKRNNQQDA